MNRGRQGKVDSWWKRNKRIKTYTCITIRMNCRRDLCINTTYSSTLIRIITDTIKRTKIKVIKREKYKKGIKDIET